MLFENEKLKQLKPLEQNLRKTIENLKDELHSQNLESSNDVAALEQMLVDHEKQLAVMHCKYVWVWKLVMLSWK